MQTMTNEELTRVLSVTLIPARDYELEIATEILARLIDGRAVLAEPMREEIEHECEHCGNDCTVYLSQFES